MLGNSSKNFIPNGGALVVIYNHQLFRHRRLGKKSPRLPVTTRIQDDMTLEVREIPS